MLCATGRNQSHRIQRVEFVGLMDCPHRQKLKEDFDSGVFMFDELFNISND